MKVLLVGEAVSRAGALPLEGRGGRRIAELAGITFEEFLERTERTNLFAEPQPVWSRAEARLSAWAITTDVVSSNRTVVLLGRRVAAAFGLNSWPWLDWMISPSANWSVMPHPSGRSRWWNSPENVSRAREFLTRLLAQPTVTDLGG